MVVPLRVFTDRVPVRISTIRVPITIMETRGFSSFADWYDLLLKNMANLYALCDVFVDVIFLPILFVFFFEKRERRYSTLFTLRTIAEVLLNFEAPTIV